MEVNWEQAPEWARWAAQDKNGDWWWYEVEPEIDKDEEIWDAPVGDFLDAFEGRPMSNDQWKDTLVSRPE